MNSILRSFISIVATILVVSVSLPVARASSGPADGSGTRWLDNREPGVSFFDVVHLPPSELVLSAEGESAPVALPFVLRMSGGTYTHVVVRRDGSLRLMAPAPQVSDTSPGQGLVAGPEIAPLGRAFVAGPASKVVWREGDGFVDVRWVRMQPVGLRGEVTWEATLFRDGALSFQYIVLGPDRARLLESSYIGTRRGDGTPLRALAEGGVFEPGFAPDNGYRVVLFPVESVPAARPVPSPDGGGARLLPLCAGDDTAPPWCDTVDPDYNADGIPDAICTENAGAAGLCGGQSGGYPQVDCSSCPDVESTHWHFYESDAATTNCYCKGCLYTFYVLVGCGSEMHIPMFDTEGMVIRMYDAVSGDALTLTAQNDCYKSPFNYCDACNVSGVGGIIPESYIESVIRPIWRSPPCPPLPSPAFCADIVCPTGGLNGLPPVACTPVNQTGQVVQWGLPTPPDPFCGSDLNTCPGGTGSNLATELTNVDILLQDPKGLCGVFRVDIKSGGCKWDLFANCNGCSSSDLNDPNCPNGGALFPIYHNCADAVMDFDPRPELFLVDFNIGPGTDCTTGVVEYVVEVTNLGCSEITTGIPIQISFDNGDPPHQDIIPYMGTPLLPNGGNSWTFTTAPIPAGSTPLQATASVDWNNAIQECSEGGAVACTFPGGDKTLNLPVCTGLCSHLPVVASVLPKSTNICRDPGTGQIQQVTLDASASTATGCTTPNEIHYQWENATAGTVEVPFGAQAMWTFTPASCDAATQFRVRVACSDEETIPDCQDTATAGVYCRTPDPVTITTDPPSNPPDPPLICANRQGITLTALVNGTPVPAGPDITWTSDNPATDGIDASNEHSNPLTVTVTAPGPYVFSVTTLDQPLPNGCPTSATQQVNAVAGAAPTPVDCGFRVKREVDPGTQEPLETLLFNWPNLTLAGGREYQIVADPCTSASDPGTCGNNRPNCPWLDSIPRNAAFPDLWATFGWTPGGTAPDNRGSIGRQYKLIFFKVRATTQCGNLPAEVGSTKLLPACGTQVDPCP